MNGLRAAGPEPLEVMARYAHDHHGMFGRVKGKDAITSHFGEEHGGPVGALRS